MKRLLDSTDDTIGIAPRHIFEGGPAYRVDCTHPDGRMQRTASRLRASDKTAISCERLIFKPVFPYVSSNADILSLLESYE
jgi:hypothetical protein